MTQTITEREGNRVHIYADHGQGRKFHRKIFDIVPISKAESLRAYYDLTQDHREDPDIWVCLDELDSLVEAIAGSTTGRVWRVSSENGAAMENVKRWHATRADAFAEAESQFC